MNERLTEQLKERLENEKSSLKKELESFAIEDKDIKHNWKAKYPNREIGNMEEEADESQEYDAMVSLEQSLEIKLKNVEMALEKLAKGEYGKCEKCEKEIEEDRLIAYPEANLCISCNK